jgi:hypothetical protein
MLESRRMSIIRRGYFICSAGFFLHIVAFDGLSLFGIRLAAGVATGMYASALIAKSYETTTGNNSKLTLVGIISVRRTVGVAMLKEQLGSTRTSCLHSAGCCSWLDFLCHFK